MNKILYASMIFLSFATLAKPPVQKTIKVSGKASASICHEYRDCETRRTGDDLEALSDLLSRYAYDEAIVAAMEKCENKKMELKDQSDSITKSTESYSNETTPSGEIRKKTLLTVKIKLKASCQKIK